MSDKGYNTKNNSSCLLDSISQLGNGTKKCGSSSKPESGSNLYSANLTPESLEDIAPFCPDKLG